MEELLREIGISKQGEYSKNNAYVIDLEDDLEFGKVYSNLENSKKIEEMEDNQLITSDDAHLSYTDTSGKYQINLIGDFKSGIYKVVINEFQGEED